MKALVTGAGREGGIGSAIVARLEADEMDVVTLDRDPGCTSRSTSPPMSCRSSTTSTCWSATPA